MSREIVSAGSPFTVAYLDRTFGGRAIDAFKVSGDDGSIDLFNVPLRINGSTQFGKAVTTVSAKVTDTVTCTLQLQDGAGNNLARKCRVTAWVSMTPGATSVGDDTTGLTTAVTVGIAVYVPVANVVFECLTDATGKLTMTLTDSAGTTTRYLNFEMPDGSIVSSAAITTT